MTITCFCGPDGTARQVSAYKVQVGTRLFGRPVYGSRHRWVNVCRACGRQHPALPPKLPKRHRPLPGQRSFGW